MSPPPEHDHGSGPPVDYNDNAVDDTDEADGEFVMLQKTLSQKKRAAKDSESRIHKVLPFAFSPNIRPLSVSDLESVVALENAAFHDPAHRASPEKVFAGVTNRVLLALTYFSSATDSQHARSSASAFSAQSCPTN